MKKNYENEDRLLEKNPLFSYLNIEEFRRVCAQKKYHLYHKNQVIFYEGTPAEIIYLLIEGKVKVHKHGIFGKEQIVRMAKDGDVLTYRAIGGVERYVVSATAMEDSMVCCLSKEDLVSVLKDNGKFAYQVVMRLTEELDSAERVIRTLAQKTVKQRVAETLITLREKYGEEADHELHIHLSRDELANLVGTATETVVRFLSDLKRKGIIEVSGQKIMILDLAMLERIASIA